VTSPARAVLFVAHIAAAVVAYGALGTTGAFARAALRSRDPWGSEAVRRFFRPGHNLAARTLYLVPVFGFALLFSGPSSDRSAAYPWIGLAIWTASIGCATGALWPAEAALQRVLASASSADSALEIRRHARVIERAGIALSVLFVAAFVVMVAQP
jgi:uncharacterized membrane protein